MTSLSTAPNNTYLQLTHTSVLDQEIECSNLSRTETFVHNVGLRKNSSDTQPLVHRFTGLSRSCGSLPRRDAHMKHYRDYPIYRCSGAHVSYTEAKELQQKSPKELLGVGEGVLVNGHTQNESIIPNGTTPHSTATASGCTIDANRACTGVHSSVVVYTCILVYARSYMGVTVRACSCVDA